jgi:hypothetical protein
VCDVSPSPSRWTAPAPSAAFRLPPGAPAPGRMGVPFTQRTAGSPRVAGGPQRHAAGLLYRVRMFWPLIVGFVLFVLLAVLLGWVMDPSRHGDAGKDGH